MDNFGKIKQQIDEVKGEMKIKNNSKGSNQLERIVNQKCR